MSRCQSACLSVLPLCANWREQAFYDKLSPRLAGGLSLKLSAIYRKLYKVIDRLRWLWLKINMLSNDIADCHHGTGMKSLEH